jgi:hypothetical protein
MPAAGPKAGRLAGATGLEPAASAVTGQRSNQLSYAPFLREWWGLKTPPDQVKADEKARICLIPGRKNAL